MDYKNQNLKFAIKIIKTYSNVESEYLIEFWKSTRILNDYETHSEVSAERYLQFPM